MVWDLCLVSCVVANSAKGLSSRPQRAVGQGWRSPGASSQQQLSRSAFVADADATQDPPITTRVRRPHARMHGCAVRPGLCVRDDATRSRAPNAHPRTRHRAGCRSQDFQKFVRLSRSCRRQSRAPQHMVAARCAVAVASPSYALGASNVPQCQSGPYDLSLTAVFSLAQKRRAS
jgi:hypothetical protein